MSECQLFYSDEFNTLRTFNDDGENVCFVATDIARALGYRDAHDLTRRLDEDEKGTHPVRTPGGEQQLSVISEAGFYNAVLGSKVEGAKRFKRWVTHEVLPQIRQQGAYVASDGTEDDATLMARALMAAQRTIERNSERIAALANENDKMRPLATFATECLDCTGRLTITEAARQLKQIDPAIGQRKLFQLLRSDGMVCKHNNQATSLAIERGYLVNYTPKPYLDENGVKRMREPYALVTPKGLKWMAERYCREGAK